MQAGDKLGHFVIQKKLGAGGMGEVYLAEDQRLGRQVAIKILPSNLSEDAGSRARFDLEARAASALSHPNIAHIYDVGEEGGTHFIAMEYVEGADLGQRIAGKGLTEDEVLKIAIQVAGALEEARDKGIIHRDIKPANIALTARDEVKVLDFGLAKLTSIPGQESAGQTLTVGQTTAGSVLGTVRYMSPEQALSKEIDTRSDLFSLGVVLFEMVAGRPPFSGTGPVETLDCIIHSQPEALARFNYEVSPELERIILKCLEKNPENRYQTPRDLLVDLRNLRQKASSSSVSAGHLSSVRPPRKRGLRFLPGILAVAVVAVAVGVYFLVPRASADVNSLAILPFENETGDPEVDYLCNGVTETLINTLSQYQDLRVISRRSAFALRGKGLDAESVGRELKVEAVLYGRVVQREDELTISTELVDTRDSRQLWGSRYSRPASEIQSIENEITHSIADKLQVGLTVEDAEFTSRQNTWNPDAYRFYLKGREFTTGTMREMDKAIEFFEDAITLEPDYALAYAGLAQAYITQSYLRGYGRDQSLEGARAAAQKAMELDPGLAEAYTARGLVRLYFDLDWEGARADLTRGVELAPGDVETLMAYGDFLACEGRYEESLAVHERALERDPLSISTAHDLGFINMARKNYEQSEYYFKMALDLSPNWAWGHIKLAKTYSHMGRCEEALAETELAEAILTGSETPSARCWLAFTYARCGEEDRARAALADLQKRSETEYVDPGLYAVIYLGLGELEPAIEAFQQSLAERSPSLVYYKMSPNLYLDELGDDPRFQAMLKEIGFD